MFARTEISIGDDVATARVRITLGTGYGVRGSSTDAPIGYKVTVVIIKATHIGYASLTWIYGLICAPAVRITNKGSPGGVVISCGTFPGRGYENADHNTVCAVAVIAAAPAVACADPVVISAIGLARDTDRLA